VFKKRQIFSQTKSRAFSRALRFETHKSIMSPHDVPSPMAISPTQEQIIYFPRKKKYNYGVTRFQKQIVLNSHQNNFCFQNARSRFQCSL
jgi:hypothetical protein